MEQPLLEIRDQQRETWNKFSPGWKKWDDFTMDFLRSVRDAIIQQLNLKEDDLVLDVAAGTGEPGLTIASKIKSGKVIITDLADDMLVVSYENAEKKRIKNVEFCACDAYELPFEDNSFDIISCRMGFLFFPDMLLAAKEMVRVLKPGGRISTSVWNIPEKNFWITAVMDVIDKNIDLPSGLSGIFRCATAGFLVDLFSRVGLKNISQKEVDGKMICKTVGMYWDYMTAVMASVSGLPGRADVVLNEKIRREVYRSLNQKYADGSLLIDSSVLIIYGEKQFNPGSNESQTKHSIVITWADE